MSLRSILLKISYPILKVLGKLEVPNRKFTGKHLSEIGKVTDRGSVLLTRKRFNFLNLTFIPNFWTHAAIYVGQVDGVPSVVEAIGAGVVVTPLVEFLFNKDYVSAYNPKFADPDQMWEAADEALKLVGSKYDYEFKGGNPAFYCSEVIWWSYDKVIMPSPFTPRKTMGEATITPEDISKADKLWKCVFSNQTVR